MISFELFGNPVPQSRPRFISKGKKSFCYNSKKKLKNSFRWQISSQFREPLIDVPVRVDLIFFMPIPGSSKKIQKRQMANGLIGHTKRPDLDNLQKFALDCLSGVVLKDDCLVCEIRAKKVYSHSPGTNIRIFPLSDDKKDLLYENCQRYF